jgi:hypothetical protein
MMTQGSLFSFRILDLRFERFVLCQKACILTPRNPLPYFPKRRRIISIVEHRLITIEKLGLVLAQIPVDTRLTGTEDDY